MTQQICQTCGAVMREHDVYDPETGTLTGTEIVCPNEWRAAHRRAEQR